jgi:hypothetical protein
MSPDNLVVGSAVKNHILLQFHKCFSLLPAAFSTMTAMLTIEATTEGIGQATPATALS